MNSDKTPKSQINSDSNRTTSIASLKKYMIPIIIVLVLIVLVLIDINNKPDIEPTNKSVSKKELSKTKESAEATQTIPKSVKEKFDESNAQLDKVISATKRTPFKARITTETGFKGFWTQSGNNYRFEDAKNQQAIIFNASKKRLWVVDLTRKIAFETKFNDETVQAYSVLSPAVFMEALTDTTETVSKKLEEILPSSKDSVLKFTKVGLPERWEGKRSDGSKCFISWDYVDLGNIPQQEFELPQGVIIKQLSAIETNANR